MSTPPLIYLAPLEGITGYAFRNALYDTYGTLDKYFIPFINPNQFGHFSSKEKADVLPEHNRGMKAIPQILTNSAEDFIRTSVSLREKFGYEEINLNLGCPSKTVISKGRGSGFLAYPDELDRFLEEIFSRLEGPVSIKTRIGKDDPAEWERLLQIYNQYPISELTVHVRVQKDFYKNTPNWEAYSTAVAKSSNPLVYNGDIFSLEGFHRFQEHFPDNTRIMLGRGILMNPELGDQIRTEKLLDQKKLYGFHQNLYRRYQEIMPGPKVILFKVKEVWFYLAPSFTNYEKYAKRIKKAQSLKIYEQAVEDLFANEKFIGHVK